MNAEAGSEVLQGSLKISVSDTSNPPSEADDGVVVHQGRAEEGTSKKRKASSMSEEEIREQRRAANRRSALESRLRRKKLIEDLQGTVDGLTTENRFLRQDNNSLRLQLAVALSDNQQLRAQMIAPPSNHGQAVPQPSQQPSINNNIVATVPSNHQLLRAALLAAAGGTNNALAPRDLGLASLIPASGGGLAPDAVQALLSQLVASSGATAGAAGATTIGAGLGINNTQVAQVALLQALQQQQQQMAPGQGLGPNRSPSATMSNPTSESGSN